MHPNVNYSIKILRDLGKKIARYFDDRSQHSSEVEFQPGPVSFLNGIVDKLFNELNRAYDNPVIIDLDKATALELQSAEHHEIWGYQVLCGYDNFLNNIPLFCLTLSNFRYGQVQHAVIYNPLTDEVYHASKGMGAQVNGHRLRIQPKNDIQMAYLNRVQDGLLSPINNCALRLLGSPNLELAYLAANRADVTLHHMADSINITAGKLIAREAGAMCFIHEGATKRDQLVLNGSIEHLKRIIDTLTQAAGSN
ncbi:hypothetical protein EBR43_03735 [bacterium]|jgi:myo-inositol-1(or 4)-monophosphatase|nr:hypothetical protein [bacterium]NBW56890.1 hypothetical protein [bacterium]NBX72274.1 hypothetical protein [bacterium]